MGWGRVEIERIGYGYGGICGHGLAVERKRQRFGLLGRIGIGLLGLAVERERPRIGLLDWIIGSCHGKEMAENQRRQGWYRERESYSCGYGGPV